LSNAFHISQKAKFGEMPLPFSDCNSAIQQSQVLYITLARRFVLL